MSGIQQLKQLTTGFAKGDNLAQFTGDFARLHDKLVNGDKQFLLISEAIERDNLLVALENSWQQNITPDTGSIFAVPGSRDNVREAWLTNTQVSFCAMAFPTVPVGHEDAAALTVLGGFLRNGFLHRAIREQGGAYGCGASQDSGTATFRFFSYRDPRLTETLNDYRRAIDWVLTGNHDPRALEEAILGVISSLDKPSSPAGTARQAFYNELFGRDREQRARFRRRILQVGLDQLKAVTEKYLANADPSLGVISNKAHNGELKALKMDIRQF
jgi:hypothetical protein